MMSQNINKRGNFIKLWLLRSEELFRAAKLVWDSDVINFPNDNSDEAKKIHAQYRPAALLMGLSLEALLKAVIINSKPLVLGEKYPKELKTHNLVELCSLAKYQISSPQKEVLERLTWSVEWVSKYPIPILEPDLKTERLYRQDSDFLTFEKIYIEIREQI